MKSILKTLIALCALLATSHANAFEVVGPAKIIYLENGWHGEGLAIHLTSEHPGCLAADNDYGVIAGHPSYKEIVALATSAFMASTDVELVVLAGPDNCVFGGRTQIVSIRLKK